MGSGEMSDTVRVGLAGVGTIARIHLEVLAGFPDVSLDFTVDPRVADPPPFRGRTPSHYPELGDALTRHQVDLVVIATPTTTHADLATQVLTLTDARVLVEKPLAHDLAALDRLRALDTASAVADRLFVAHHFAFSPEVRWAASRLAENPEWGPVTEVTSAFYDPYILLGSRASASYVSSWLDSGVNQLSTLIRFVELGRGASTVEVDNGESAWTVLPHRSRGQAGVTRLHSSWRTGSSSKKTTLRHAGSGVEIWADHTAMTALITQGRHLLGAYGNDGRTPRKIAHYRPLYESLLSDQPDQVLRLDTAAMIGEIQHAGRAQ
jgi:predicted dehydrogenase